MLWLNIIVLLFIVFCVVALLFILAIMPKMHKHEWTDEIKKYRYAHRGLFSHENKVPENSLLAFEKAIENLRVDVLAVENDFFGKTVTCTGLLTGKDILSALKEYQKTHTFDEIILPCNVLKEFEDKEPKQSGGFTEW